MSSTSPLSVTPWLSGDPLQVGPDVTSQPELLRAIGVEGVSLAWLAPGFAVLPVLEGGDGVILRWWRLPHGPTLGPGDEAVEAVVVCTAPPSDVARALRVLERLAGILDQATVRQHALAATTREALVGALAAGDATTVEKSLPARVLLELLRTSANGLSAGEAGRRLAVVGPNAIERVRHRSPVLRLLRPFWSFFAVLLWVAGGLAIIAGMPQLGVAIFVVIVVNGAFSFLQEYRAERAIETLARLLPYEVTVLRDGADTRIPATAIVMGDVIRVGEGDRVPADAQLIEALALRVDQAALTGESHPVFKLPSAGGAGGRFEERHDLLFAGTGVVAGSAIAVVRATAMHTEIGRIATLTQGVAEESSPLERELNRVTRVVTLISVSLGALFFGLSLVGDLLPAGEAFLFSLGIIVANVPEGLLPTLTLALAMAAQRMARERCLVKRLSALETLGATTVICTDKTGTLTEGRMEVRQLWAGGASWAPSTLETPVPVQARRLATVAVLASQATADHGDPSEVAIVRFATRIGLDTEGLRRAQRILAPYPFDSFRRRMTLVRAEHDGATACVKGAPADVLAFCTRVRLDPQTAAQLTDEMRSRILGEQDRLAGEGWRILAVAERQVPDPLVGASAEAVERELTFLGLLALWDPPRADVTDAITRCQHAGIRIVMVTGDHGLTAQAIARRIGLPVRKVVAGQEVERLDVEALGALASESGILFARTLPSHKLAIVRALHARGDVVAVTGDGVNDAPALRAADVGVAMGRRGSDVAKEAALVVVTDDHFASIVSGIRRGRAIWANAGKFVRYIFASNVPELVPFLASVLFGLPLALTVMQILAVDLGTDLLPALALGAEPPEPGGMDVPPRARSERLLGPRRLLHAYGFLGVIEAVLSMLAFFWAYWSMGWQPGMALATEGPLYRRATTMAFAAIVAGQVGNAFACRTERESIFRAGLMSNRYVLAGIVAEIAILLGLIHLPVLREVFGLERLGSADWGLLATFPFIILSLEEMRKAWVRHRGTRWRS